MRAFGLDISDSIIRLAVLERRRGRYSLPIRGEIAVPEGVIVDGDIRQPKDVTQLLRDLLHAAAPKTKHAVVCLPERHTFIKLLTIDDDQSRTDIEAMVHAATAQHVPVGWEDLYLDWRMLPDRNTLHQRQVLLAAAPKPLVDSYVLVLNDAGIDPIALDMESMAIARALVPEHEQRGTHLLLDIGRTRTSLAIVRNGVVLFSTALRYAGKDMNRFIADELSISLDQAERAKQLFGLDPKRGRGVLRKVLSPHLDILAEKIRDIDMFYAEHFPDHEPITSIILNGSGAKVVGLDQELTARLGRPVEAKSSWLTDHIGEDASSTFGFTYTTALGAALVPLSGTV